jgi:hypothetical protein
MESMQAFAPYQDYESEKTENKFNEHITTSIQGLLISPSAKRYILNKPNKLSDLEKRIKENLMLQKHQGGSMGGKQVVNNN